MKFYSFKNEYFTSRFIYKENQTGLTNVNTTKITVKTLEELEEAREQLLNMVASEEDIQKITKNLKPTYKEVRYVKQSKQQNVNELKDSFSEDQDDDMDVEQSRSNRFVETKKGPICPGKCYKHSGAGSLIIDIPNELPIPSENLKKLIHSDDVYIKALIKFSPFVKSITNERILFLIKRSSVLPKYFKRKYQEEVGYNRKISDSDYIRIYDNDEKFLDATFKLYDLKRTNPDYLNKIANQLSPQDLQELAQEKEKEKSKSDFSKKIKENVVAVFSFLKKLVSNVIEKIKKSTSDGGALNKFGSNLKNKIDSIGASQYEKIIFEMEKRMPNEIKKMHESPEKKQKEIFFLVNEYRKSIGKTPLLMDFFLNDVAIEQSVSMYERTNMQNKGLILDHDGIKERSKKIKRKINVLGIAENVVFNSSASKALVAWLESSGHRANIEGDYTHIGIAVKQDKGGFFATQIFIKKT